MQQEEEKENSEFQNRSEVNDDDRTRRGVRQRDRMTYAVVTPDDLEKTTKAGRAYKVPMLKVTSGQRIALDCVQRLAVYYRRHAKPYERTAMFMERVGMGDRIFALGKQGSRLT